MAGQGKDAPEQLSNALRGERAVQATAATLSRDLPIPTSLNKGHSVLGCKKKKIFS